MRDLAVVMRFFWADEMYSTTNWMLWRVLHVGADSECLKRNFTKPCVLTVTKTCDFRSTEEERTSKEVCRDRRHILKPADEFPSAIVAKGL